MNQTRAKAGGSAQGLRAEIKLHNQLRWYSAQKCCNQAFKVPALIYGVSQFNIIMMMIMMERQLVAQPIQGTVQHHDGLFAREGGFVPVPLVLLHYTTLMLLCCAHLCLVIWNLSSHDSTC